MTHQSNGKPNDAASFRGEKIIRLKEVSALPIWLERPSYQRVKRWVKYGFTIDGVKVRLRSRREGQFRLTSVEAVMEFQGAEPMSDSKQITTCPFCKSLVSKKTETRLLKMLKKLAQSKKALNR